jgi:hypothetical protein
MLLEPAASILEREQSQGTALWFRVRPAAYRGQGGLSRGCEELSQGTCRGFDIGSGEHSRDHREAIRSGIDDLTRVIDGDATNGEHRYGDALLDLPKNSQRDIGALAGFRRGGKGCAKGHIVSPRLLSGHRARHIAVTRGADDGIGAKKGTGLVHWGVLATDVRPISADGFRHRGMIVDNQQCPISSRHSQ